MDALLITHPANWYYLTAFTGESGMLLASRGGATLISDGRFTTQAREEAPSVHYIEQKGSLVESTGRLLKEKSLRRIGFDPSQISVAQLRFLRRAAGARTQWISAPGLVESLRLRKAPGELAVMRRAAILAGEVLTGALKLLKPGVTENEVAAEIEYQMRKGGASGPAFETIVAFGERSALPHARPTAKRLRKNELVVLDLGVILAHYCSDITRTVYVGRQIAGSQLPPRGWYFRRDHSGRRFGGLDRRRGRFDSPAIAPQGGVITAEPGEGLRFPNDSREQRAAVHGRGGAVRSVFPCY